MLFEKWSVDFSTDHFLLFVIYFTPKIKISCDKLRKLLLMNDLVLTFGKNVFWGKLSGNVKNGSVKFGLKR